MEKTALFELGLSSIRLTLCKVKEGEYFFPYKQFSEHIGIDKLIHGEKLITSAKIRECINILQMYKKICEAQGVSRYMAVACETVTWAKNYQSFVGDCGVAIGVDFKIMSPAEEVSALYTAVTNTLDTPKGIILNITSNSVRVIHYNRRIVLDSATFDIGAGSLFHRILRDTGKLKKGAGVAAIPVELDEHGNIKAPKRDKEEIVPPKETVEWLKKHIMEKAPFLQTLDPEATIVGVGETFLGLGKLARKMAKSHVDIEHNFQMETSDASRVFNFLAGLDAEKRTKLKGVSEQSTANVLAGLCVLEAIIQLTQLKQIVVGRSYRNIGLMFNHAVPLTLERPVADILGYSLDAIVDSARLNKKLADSMYAVSLMLFKQLKVLHKLPRNYARVLRIASNLHEMGKKVNYAGFERNNLHAIMAGPVMGCAHKEVILASFVASIKRWEDFNAADWVRYNDVVNDEDLEAVKKLSNILAIAAALNIRNQDVVKDITCDILGDSVILKLVTETDAKQASKADPYAAYIEIYHAKKYCAEFRRAFKKSLEIL